MPKLFSSEHTTNSPENVKEEDGFELQEVQAQYL